MELLRDRELVITKIHSWRLATVGETPRTVDYPSRNSHGIQLRLSGETVFTICGKEYPSRKDDVIFLPQGLAYSIRNPAAASCLIVNFCTEKEYDLRPRFLHFVNTSVLRKALTDGCALNHKGTAAARCRRFALAYNIVALVQEAVDADYRTSRQRKLIAPAEEYLASCSGAELARIRVADLAAICSIGETYFR